MLATLEGNGRYMDRATFEADMVTAAKNAGVKILAPIKKASSRPLASATQTPRFAWTARAGPSRTVSLGTPKNIPLPPGTGLPLPMDFGPNKPNDRLVDALPGRNRRLPCARGAAPCA